MEDLRAPQAGERWDPMGKYVEIWGKVWEKICGMELKGTEEFSSVSISVLAIGDPGSEIGSCD
jgi:hypothetical protein